VVVAVMVNRKVFFVQTSVQFKLTLPGRDTKFKVVQSSDVWCGRGIQI